MSAAAADQILFEADHLRRQSMGLPPRAIPTEGGAAPPTAPQGGDMDIGMLANLAIEYIKYNKDVSELYSPPRVCSTALKIGPNAGTSFDLTELDPIDNKPWDFNDPVKREREREREIGYLGKNHFY